MLWGRGSFKHTAECFYQTEEYLIGLVCTSAQLLGTGTGSELMWVICSPCCGQHPGSSIPLGWPLAEQLPKLASSCSDFTEIAEATAPHPCSAGFPGSLRHSWCWVRGSRRPQGPDHRVHPGRSFGAQGLRHTS